jgi:prefoldin alpha subunit
MADKTDKKLEESQQRVQQKYMELQMLDQQMKQVQKQVEAIERQAVELEDVQLSLDELAKSKKGSDMFVPITNGIFLKAKLEETETLAVNVGGGTVVKKDIASTKAMLAQQAVEMRKFQADMVEQFEKMAERAASLQTELQELVGA